MKRTDYISWDEYFMGISLLSGMRSIKEFVHKHDGIYYDNFGVSCLMMEQTEEFKKLDKLFTKTEKNDIIKSKYLLRRD